MSSRSHFIKLLYVLLGVTVGVLLFSVYSNKNEGAPKASVVIPQRSNRNEQGSTKHANAVIPLKDKPQSKESKSKGQKARRFPNCLIIGAKKGGTKALVEYLNIHPDIVRRPNECHFFDYDTNYEKGFEYYRKLMPQSYPNQVIVEKSPAYLVSEKAIQRIHRFNESIRLIVTLRNPVTRLVSEFEHNRRHNKLMRGKTLEELAINSTTGEVNEHYGAVHISTYYIHMKRWLDYFPEQQIHVVDGDNLIVNPVEELEKIETFLGLRHAMTKDKVYFDKKKGFYCMVQSGGRQCLSKLKGNEHDPIDKKTNKTLMQFFDPYNKQLSELLGREFDW